MTNLFPAWEHLNRLPTRVEEDRPSIYWIRKDTRVYSKKPVFVDSKEGAEAMLEFTYQQSLSHIGFDTEFKYDQPGVLTRRDREKFDPAAVRPLLLSLSLARLTEKEEGFLYNFVVDLRNTRLIPILKELFKIQVTFVSHYAKAELFCLWQLGIEEPGLLWDTYVCEVLLKQGRNHRKHAAKSTNSKYEQIRAEEEATAKAAAGLSLVATCHRYGLPYSMETVKDRLQRSFLDHPKIAPFTAEQIRYSAEDAIAVSKLYPQQVKKATAADVLHHCFIVEMPWTTVNARIEWTGVRIDALKQDKIKFRVKKIMGRMEEFIATEYGIKNVRSPLQLTKFFRGAGLLKAFERRDKISFDRKNLNKNKEKHPVIPLLKATRRASDILSNELLTTRFVGKDGRVRADYRQIGTATGRQTSKHPNLLGLDRILCPLIIPETGYGIGEVDWCQVEVGVAAAVYGDSELMRMFNSGDVYSGMAQLFFKDELTPEDRKLSGNDFKAQHKDKRNQMKTCTLGMMYGMTPFGLAQLLKIDRIKAATLQERFMNMFPQLQDALRKAPYRGGFRGYVSAVGGLKRYVSYGGVDLHRDKNWMVNHSVQGSAAVVFKAAGIRLDRKYRQFKARIILPLHDSYVFEAPLEHVEAVADLTSRVMCDTLQEYFPVLQPRVDVNIGLPSCWNKDGTEDALNQWEAGLESFVHTTLWKS